MSAPLPTAATQGEARVPVARRAARRLQYAMCSALLYGRVDEQTCGRFTDQDLQRLTDQTTRTMQEEHGQALLEARQSGRVEVHLTDGCVLGATVDDVPGLDEEGVERRLRQAAAGVVPRAALDQIVDVADRLRNQPDCEGLFESLPAARPITG